MISIEILWGDYIETDEETPEFIKNRYTAMDGLFRGVLNKNKIYSAPSEHKRSLRDKLFAVLTFKVEKATISSIYLIAL
ncbi:MAG: hypothetical protein O2970_07025 [Proteobacteria bacterium]|nr:hypothetical protein [Pseudomonadota bacterium]MDG4547358.1 hypothetical protein [Rickettsiales bacterium]